MKRAIDVMLGEGPQVGTLRHDLQGRRENATFEYSAGWLGADARFALGPTLPLKPGPQFHRKSKDGSLFHAAIADTEPDGWGRRVIMRDQAKRRHESRLEGKAKNDLPLNALDYLLAVDDTSRVGALRFRDEGGLFQRAPEEGRRTAPPLIELGHLLNATRAVESNQETAADLAYLRITQARAKEILGQVARAVGEWRKTGRAIGMIDEELEAFADAFEHAERTAVKKQI